jgi:cytochrome b6-f complex iron-sulfur subunit
MNAGDTREPARWLLRLFPRAWRARYADELLALLAAAPPSPRDYLDILLSACDARLHPHAWALQAQPAAAGAAPAGRPTPPLIAGISHPHPVMSRRFSRRTFLRNAVLGGAVIAASGTAAGTAVFAWPNKTSPFGTELALPLSIVPPVGAPPYQHLPGKFWLINNADGVLALYWRCTHLGCTVPWNEKEGQFHCPCHSSQYNRYGERTAGPAPRPLDLMAVRVGPDGNLYVHTGQISTRERYAPDQALKV